MIFKISYKSLIYEIKNKTRILKINIKMKYKGQNNKNNSLIIYLLKNLFKIFKLKLTILQIINKKKFKSNTNSLIMNLKNKNLNLILITQVK